MADYTFKTSTKTGHKLIHKI